MFTFELAEFRSNFHANWADVRGKLAPYVPSQCWERDLFRTATGVRNSTLYTLQCAPTVGGRIEVLVKDGFLYYDGGRIVVNGEPSVEVKVCDVSFQHLIDNEFFANEQHNDLIHALYVTPFGRGLVAELSRAEFQITTTSFDTKRTARHYLGDGTFLDIVIRTFKNAHIQFDYDNVWAFGPGVVHIHVVRRFGG